MARKLTPTGDELLGRNAKPYFAYEHTIADVAACQAVAAGTASPDQQRRAYRWIVEHGAGTYQLPFFPGEPQAGDFMSGRMFVGQKLVLFTKVSIQGLKKKLNPSTPPSETGA